MPGRLILYVRDVDAVADFYCARFSYVRVARDADRLADLQPGALGGIALLLHPAARSQKTGQVVVKLVFDVPDVAARRRELIAAGVKVGPVHDGGGYSFANLKDPAGNAVQLSSRSFVVDA